MQPNQDPLQTGGLAVLLGRMAVDSRALLDYLAGSFAQVMPSATVVQRKGLFNLGRAVAVQVHLGREVYHLADVKGRIETSVGSSVGGVALHRDSVPVEEWVQRLTAALDRAAQQDDAVRNALSQLL